MRTEPRPGEVWFAELGMIEKSRPVLILAYPQPADARRDPVPDHGFWYLLRAGNCTGVGSYDTPGVFQAAPRDLQIAASGHACP